MKKEEKGNQKRDGSQSPFFSSPLRYRHSRRMPASQAQMKRYSLQMYLSLLTSSSLFCILAFSFLVVNKIKTERVSNLPGKKQKARFPNQNAIQGYLKVKKNGKEENPLGTSTFPNPHTSYLPFQSSFNHHLPLLSLSLFST
jgi:hypothetical protein